MTVKINKCVHFTEGNSDLQSKKDYEKRLNKYLMSFSNNV